MNKLLFFILLSVLPGYLLQANSLKAYMSYAIFKTPDNMPYVETYLTIKGNSVKYTLQENGNYSSVVDVQIIFRKNDSIINFDKYVLTGMEVSDTSRSRKNLLDIQRYALPAGNYELELNLKDRADNVAALVNTVEFTIGFPDNSMSFSDIEFLQSYEKSDDSTVLDKNGYRLIPYVFNYLPESVTSLSFYAELYGNPGTIGESFLLNYYIRPYELDKKLDRFFYRKKLTAEPINVLLKSIDISQLPGGNYLLVLESRNRDNELMASKEIFFQRSNPGASFNITNMLLAKTENTFVSKITNRDTLLQYIKFTYPISTEAEKYYAETQSVNENLESLQKYFYIFWLERNKLHPDEAWEDYYQRVKQANKNFRTVSREGYMSDRGRVYLQYGQPNVISESHHEPAAFPFEIWHYYKLDNQTDIRFVFYTQEIATNDFQLIHSTAKGELRNYRWQTVIYSRTWDPPSVDDAVIPDTWGSNASEFYLRPR
ncbi:MAG: GWxTD domain-containing protein [Bacteroidales bacterium]|nr:GWxTD domain-containing protein [Bacteroidales bacterium]